MKSHQNSLFVAFAHFSSASTAASTVAALTEKRQGSTASMNAATCGTPGGGCPKASVGVSVGVYRLASARIDACWCGSYSCAAHTVYTIQWYALIENYVIAT